MNSEDLSCKTIYPILLAHGLGFRDVTGFFKYWGDIPEKLASCGAAVYLGNQDAFGTFESNAILLKERITNILDETGSEKINIIAHSKGGLESRYLITKLDMASKVSSLTTLATPHRGSALADIILEKIPKKKISKKILDVYWKMMGDKNPNSIEAGESLTAGQMEKFNTEIVDARGVYYQSYGGAIDHSYPNPVWRKMYKTLKDIEGENDGLVSVSSCQWGTFRGVVTVENKPLVSHADIIGLHAFSGVKKFNTENFFRSIVHDLRLRGF